MEKLKIYYPNSNGKPEYQFSKYPDAQKNLKLLSGIVSRKTDVRLIELRAKVHCDQHLFGLQLLVDALTRQGHVMGELHLEYLFGMRSDRPFDIGGAVPLQVIANVINSLKFKRVFIYDGHSVASESMIKKSTNLFPLKAYKLFLDGCDTIVFPDKGAARKRDLFPKKTRILVCSKVRDANHVPHVKLPKFKGSLGATIVIDDLCDGGGTFSDIGNQLKPHTTNLMLYVTHGLFTKGYNPLTMYDAIITSTSCSDLPKETRYNNTLIQYRKIEDLF